MADAPADVPASPAAGPNRRPVTIALILVAALVAVVVYTVLGRENEPSPVDEVASALAARAPELAGPLGTPTLQHTRCVAQPTADTYRCTPVMDNARARDGVTVRFANGALTKRLAGPALSAPPRTGDAVAAALGADERASLGRTVKYGCAFSSGINPDGTPAASSGGGFRCATAEPPAGESAILQRYVEFAADGTVTRDFMLTTE